MTLAEISSLRLANQHITAATYDHPQDLIAHLGAAQAQDYPMSKWAIGLRLSSHTDREMEAAFDNATIVRTHVLRPTWHLAPAADIRWMLELTAPRIRATMKSSNLSLELNEPIFQRSKELIQKSLAGGQQRTRAELMAELGAHGIRTDEHRAAHIMFEAELDAIVCNGSMRGKQFTYALLDERIPTTPKLTKEEALATLARRYFISHGPATLRDFGWWSGLSAGDARLGLELCKADLVSVQVDGQTYWLAPQTADQIGAPEGIHLLPAFDEFMVSYTDRSAALDPASAQLAILSNGIFKPIVVVNGRVAGIWKRTIKKGFVEIETTLLTPISPSQREAIALAAERYGQFLETRAVLSGEPV